MRCPAQLHAHAVVARIGESDCEELGDGLLAQPVNALTSLSYVVVGAVVVWFAWRGRRAGALTPGAPARHVATVVFALLLAAVGLGSVAFHGPQPAGSRLMHDTPILLTVLFMLSVDVALLSTRIRRWWTLFWPAAGVGIIVSLISPDAGVALTGSTIVALVGAEVLVHRRRLRTADERLRRRAYAFIIGVTAVAGATWILGRTGGPACDPDGVVQFHGLWHVLTALVFGAWWWVAIGSESPSGDALSSASDRSAPVAPTVRHRS